MPLIPYSKPALTLAQQLQQLKDRGLIIENDDKAKHLLENVSYYRLSGYWYPFIKEPKSAHQFKRDASFNQAFRLYCFDRELRKLVNSELEKVEVAIRAKMIYILAHQYGPFWYSNSALFANHSKFSSTLSALQKEYNRSREDFVLAFKVKYSDPLPPSWMIFEIASFGVLSHLYENLKPSRQKREIAQYFGLDNTTFTSWLHSIVYIRNLCAHHSRLWNRRLSVAPNLPLNTHNQWLVVTTKSDTRTGITYAINNSTYYVLSMILYFVQTINKESKFKRKILRLLNKYPAIDPAAMGFTRNWKTEPLWIEKSLSFKINLLLNDLF
ncbi:Abi family protein [Mucilaginibacter panaciglaebae]|uniref:Abi family protein n=1 Tax=Mucilaginibacter panaciglaebae TaxID=502331 RepID=A0ABP7WQG5_9SPHI